MYIILEVGIQIVPLFLELTIYIYTICNTIFTIGKIGGNRTGRHDIGEEGVQ